MSSRADALWASQFAEAAESGEAPGAYDWRAQLEPDGPRYHDTPLRSHPTGGPSAPGPDVGLGDHLSATLDFAPGLQASPDLVEDTPVDVGGTAGHPPGAFFGGGGGSGGGELYVRPDAAFPDYSGFSFADIDLTNVLDIDIENTVTMVMNVLIDIDIAPGATVVIDSLADLIPDMTFDMDELGLPGLSDVSGLFSPFDLDSFAALGGFAPDGASVDVDVLNLADIDITNEVTLIQNIVIDIDLGEGSTLIIDDDVEAAFTGDAPLIQPLIEDHPIDAALSDPAPVESGGCGLA